MQEKTTRVVIDDVTYSRRVTYDPDNPWDTEVAYTPVVEEVQEPLRRPRVAIIILF